MQSISFAKIMRQKGIKPPPLCFVVKQNIGEVSCNDGGVKFFKNLFGGFFNSPRRQECTYRQEIHCQNSSLSPHELSTETSSYSSKKDFFRLSSKEWITLQAEIIHTENKTNNPLVFIRHYHLRIPTRGLSQSIRFLKT